MNKILKIIISVAVPLLIGFIGSLFTTKSISGWYAYLVKPSFNPPDWIFGPVWTILYILMGLSFYFIWTKKSKLKKTAITLFIIQIILNLFWSILFFGLKSPLLAFFEIVILWIFIAATMFFFYRIYKPACYLMVPYILWVSFAAILNFLIYYLNRI